MTIAALQKRYDAACAELGDLVTKQRRNARRMAELEAEIDRLNDLASLSRVPEVPDAPPSEEDKCP